MAAPKQLVLITGASQGLGLVTAKALAKKNFHVILGVRDTSKGENICEDIRKEGGEASVLQIDLMSEQSVKAAIKTMEDKFGYLDVLINNAGILLDTDKMDIWEMYTRTYTTNVFGPGVLTEGLVPLLRKAKVSPPRVVFLSSTMGSLQVSLDKTKPWYPIDYKVYDASKAAVNMLAVNYARVLDDVNGKVNVVCPGYLKTGLSKFYEYGDAPEDGIPRVIEMATLGPDGPTGTFSTKYGPVPW